MTQAKCLQFVARRLLHTEQIEKSLWSKQHKCLNKDDRNQMAILLRIVCPEQQILAAKAAMRAAADETSVWTRLPFLRLALAPKNCREELVSARVIIRQCGFRHSAFHILNHAGAFYRQLACKNCQSVVSPLACKREACFLGIFMESTNTIKHTVRS